MEDRFWDKVSVCPYGGCWEWVGARVPEGYGHLSVSGRRVGAHRVSYELHNGAIPEGRVVRHRCDNPGCVNPDHLLLGTCADNSADMVGRGRQAQGSRNGQSKLTELGVAEIKKRLRAGESGRSLADEFGVTETNISYIKNGKAWKHVE